MSDQKRQVEPRDSTLCKDLMAMARRDGPLTWEDRVLIGRAIAALAATPTSESTAQGLPNDWELVEKKTCYQLTYGNEVVANLVGPEAARNAGIIARALVTQPTTIKDEGGMTQQERDILQGLSEINAGLGTVATQPTASKDEQKIEPLNLGEIRALMDKHGIDFKNINTVAALVRDVELEHGRGVANPSQRPAQQGEAWISVEQQLPPKNVEVLIAFRDTSLPATGQYTGRPRDHEGWSFPAENDPDDCGPVTYWKPLPDHPNAAALSQRGGA